MSKLVEQLEMLCSGDLTEDAIRQLAREENSVFDWLSFARKRVSAIAGVSEDLVFPTWFVENFVVQAILVGLLTVANIGIAYALVPYWWAPVWALVASLKPLRSLRSGVFLVRERVRKPPFVLPLGAVFSMCVVWFLYLPITSSIYTWFGLQEVGPFGWIVLLFLSSYSPAEVFLDQGSKGKYDHLLLFSWQMYTEQVFAASVALVPILAWLTFSILVYVDASRPIYWTAVICAAWVFCLMMHGPLNKEASVVSRLVGSVGMGVPIGMSFAMLPVWWSESNGVGGNRVMWGAYGIAFAAIGIGYMLPTQVFSGMKQVGPRKGIVILAAVNALFLVPGVSFFLMLAVLLTLVEVSSPTLLVLASMASLGLSVYLSPYILAVAFGFLPQWMRREVEQLMIGITETLRAYSRAPLAVVN